MHNFFEVPSVWSLINPELLKKSTGSVYVSFFNHGIPREFPLLRFTSNTPWPFMPLALNMWPSLNGAHSPHLLPPLEKFCLPSRFKSDAPSSERTILNLWPPPTLESAASCSVFLLFSLHASSLAGAPLGARLCLSHFEVPPIIVTLRVWWNEQTH